jgi:ATP-dependent exoDNAse (exonuclease V) alpha subunit
MRRADHYEIGDAVRFGRDYQRLGITKGVYATITGVDADRNQLTVITEAGLVASYNPRIHTKTECFAKDAREIQVGDQLRVTRNDKESHRTNGQLLMVDRIDGTQISARDDRGRLQTIDTSLLRNSHLEYAYCSTAYAGQGKTADRVFIHAESFRANLANQQSFYVGVSRAKDEVRIYTDDRQRLITQIERETGEKSRAIDKSLPGNERDSQLAFLNVDHARQPRREQVHDFEM